MSITGYHDGTVIRVDVKMDQKVIVIPIEKEMDLGESAAGGLRQYANSSMIEWEKEAWRKAAVQKHAGE